MKIEFNEKNHRYKVDGEYKPNVTTITGMLNKRQLPKWYANMSVDYIVDNIKELMAGNITIIDNARNAAEKERNRAAEIGNQLHKAIEAFFKNDEAFDVENLLKETQHSYNHFLSWIMKVNFKCTTPEIKLYNKEHDYCGKGDAPGVLFGVRTFADWKSGKNIYLAEHIMQLAAYIKADESAGAEKYEQGLIARFPTEGEFEEKKDIVFVNRDEIETAFDAFLNLKNIYWFNRKCKKSKKVKDK